MGKTLVQQIAIMQAFANGKPIEFGNKDMNPDSYMEIDDPTWNWSEYDYRVKKQSHKERTDIPLFVGYLKKRQRNEVTINTTLFDNLDSDKAYFIKVYETKQKNLKDTP